MSANEPGLLMTDGATTSRRRSAPRAERTSDVTRTHGWLAGALVGGLGLLAALLVDLQGGAHLGSSRALSLPHREADLDCASCHGEGRPRATDEQHDPTAACGECHDNQPSTRAPHARLRAAGTMTCVDCHRIHQAEGGVTFVPGEPGIRWRNGDEQVLDELAIPRWTGREPSTVALVELAACDRCHDPSRADDPMAHCALQGHTGPRDPVVCFDEHQPLLQAAAGERAALWELAREAAAATTASLGDDGDDPGDGDGDGDGGLRPWLWLSAAGLGAGLGLGGGRLWARRRDRRHQARAARAQGEQAATLRPAERRRLPTVDATTCIGCNACIDACPYDVLELRAYVAVVARPDDCCGLSLCEQRCPNGSLVISEGERRPELPPIDDGLQARGAPGIYLAGDITGLPLIRNAINQGAHAVQAIADSLRSDPGGDMLDLVIVGAGPAGISAALEAKRLGLRYRVLEQASAAESIRSFPRGKLVFDQPLGMPMVGDLWLRESSKEELLGKWLRIIHAQNLDIRERAQVLGCQRIAGGPPRGHLRVQIRDRLDGSEHSLDCARVLLAFGRRGTPRKLAAPIADAMLDHVHYSLADAASFAGRSLLIVGLGDVAMEAAIALAHQPQTRVAVSARGRDFSRGKRRNIDELRRLSAAGRVELLWQTQVQAIEPGQALLRDHNGAVQARPIDAVLVMIGGEAPTALLRAFAVEPGVAS